MPFAHAITLVLLSTSNEVANMNRLLAIAARLSIFAALVAIAIVWRDFGPTLSSSKWLASRLAPDGNLWSLADAAVNCLVILGTVFAVIRGVQWIRYRARKPASPDTSTPATPNDRPIAQSHEDALSRSPTVQGIVDVLNSTAAEDNNVVAIEGEWGSGKTSVLKLVKAELDRGRDTDPVVVEFDPWPEDSKRGVVSRLLDVIAHRIGHSNRLHPRSRAETERLLTWLADSVANEYGQARGDVFKQVLSWIDPKGLGAQPKTHSSLEANRQRIADAMTDLGRRLLIVVDDLDRVDQDELVAILMSVNALAQLPRTNFLLAFDPDVVDEILQAKGMQTRKRSFREKIVHVSVALPPPSFIDLSKLFQKSLHGFLTARNLAPHWEFWSEHAREESIILSVRLSPTPRSLKRLANHTSMLLLRLRREVHAPDVLLLEVARAQFPELWSEIRAKRNSLDPLDTLPEGYIDSDATFAPEPYSAESGTRSKTQRSTVAEQLMESLTAEKRASASQLLIALFPQMFAKGRSAEVRASAIRHSRVEIGSNLRRYFSLGVEGSQIVDDDVRTVISNASFRLAILQQSMIGGFLDGMLSSVASHIDPQARVIEPLGLVGDILSLARTAWLTQKLDVSESAAAVIRSILKSEPKDERPKLLNFVASSLESISTSHVVILDLLEQAELWRTGRLTPRKSEQVVFYESQLVPDSDLYTAKDLWLRTAWTVGIASLFSTEPRPMRIIFRLGQLEGSEGDYTRTRKELWQFLLDDSNLLRFVSEYSPQLTGQNFSLSGIEKLVQNWEEFLNRVKALPGPPDAIEKFNDYEVENRPGS